MSKHTDIVFLADETDDLDLHIVFSWLGKLGITARRIHPSSLSFDMQSGSIVPRSGSTVLAARLVVGWVFEKWLAPGAILLDMLECAGMRVVNGGSVLISGQNKALMSAKLCKAGVPHSRLLFSFDRTGIVEPLNLERQKEFVSKPGLVNSGGISVCASGSGICRVNATQVDALHVTLSNLGQPVYLQEYVQRKDNSDIRIWAFGDGAYVAVRKTPPRGSWITNTSTGATLEAFKPTEDMVRVAFSAAEAIGAPIAGVDLAETECGAVVLEVNTCPTFSPSQCVVGDSVPHTMARFLSKVLADESWRKK